MSETRGILVTHGVMAAGEQRIEPLAVVEVVGREPGDPKSNHLNRVSETGRPPAIRTSSSSVQYR